MSKKKEKEKEEGGEGEAEGAASPWRMPRMLAVVNSLATGGVGFLVVSSAGAEPAETTPIDESIPPTPVPLDPFVVNLNEPKSSRYLKATIEVEVHGEELVVLVEQKKRAIRADLLRYLPGLTGLATTGQAKKLKICDQLMARFEEQPVADPLAGRYLTELVVQ